MTTRLSTASRNAAANAVADLVDAGSGAGVVQIRSGAQPATGEAAATGTLLATITLADPAFSDAATGVCTLLGVPLTGAGVADGTAGWFRILDSADAKVFDGTVTGEGGGGQLELNTTAINTGADVVITGGTLTQPG